MRRLSILALAGIVCLGIALVIALALRRSAQARISEATKIAVPPGIDSLEQARLGGLDQWILIRGHYDSDEILLFVHGGPGVPHMPLCHLNAELEKHFVVVQWDQRGAGKSYSSSVPDESMNIEQFVSDTHELTELLLARFEKQKIYLLGHSWGSVVGAKTAARYPESFHAYIGVSQVTDVIGTQELLYEQTLAAAKAAERPEAIRELEAIGAPPFAFPGDHIVACRWLAEFQNRPFISRWKLISEIVRSPYYSIGDLNRFRKGMKFSLDHLWQPLGEVNLLEEITAFEIPVIFIHGRKDPLIPGELVERYIGTLDAPNGKELIWLEGAGHMPQFETPDEFQRAVIGVALDSP